MLEQAQQRFLHGRSKGEKREKHADQEDVSRKGATPLTNHLYVRPCSGETLVAVLAVTTSHRALATE